jgi:hypothetical protein
VALNSRITRGGVPHLGPLLTRTETRNILTEIMRPHITKLQKLAPTVITRRQSLSNVGRTSPGPFITGPDDLIHSNGTEQFFCPVERSCNATVPHACGKRLVNRMLQVSIRVRKRTYTDGKSANAGFTLRRTHAVIDFLGSSNGLVEFHKTIAIRPIRVIEISAK